MVWREEYQRRIISVDTAAEMIKTGGIIHTSAGRGCPIDIMKSTVARYRMLKTDLNLNQSAETLIATSGPAFRVRFRHDARNAGSSR